MKISCFFLVCALIVSQRCFSESNPFAESCSLEAIQKKTSDGNKVSVLDVYNLINKNKFLYHYFKVYTFEFPELKYVKDWDDWVVIDTNVKMPELFSTKEEYLGESNYSLFYNNDYLRIENKPQVTKDPKIVIEAKLFNSTQLTNLWGVNYSYSSSTTFSDAGYKFFEVLNDSVVNDATSTVFTEPELKSFFVKRNMQNKFSESSCIKLRMNFKRDSTTFSLEPIFVCENMCDKATGRQYQKKCNTFKKIDIISISYIFNEERRQFILKRP